VSSVESRDPKALEAALEAALVDRTAPIAVKIGMLPDGLASQAVQRALRKFEGPVVFDPVLGASSGGALYRGEPAALLDLGRRVTLFTPNALEAVRLTKGEVVETVDLAGAERVGRALVAADVSAVLVKGGHVDGPWAVDLLIRADGVQRFEAPRWPGPPVRGTGCALATAIAVGLARGLELERAVGAAKTWLHQAIAGAVAVGAERHLG
jgi:hydroxymethylpyrimidine/phosphomethylpyrimidine kinase